MPLKSPSHVVVQLPEGVAPSNEMSDVLIKRFLKICKKENIAQNVFEKSGLVKRFERPSEIERQRKMKCKRRALKEYADAQKKDYDTKLPKNNKKHRNITEKKNG